MIQLTEDRTHLLVLVNDLEKSFCIKGQLSDLDRSVVVKVSREPTLEFLKVTGGSTFKCVVRMDR